MNFGITCPLDFRDSWVYIWLLDFYLLVFYNNYNKIFCLPCHHMMEMSLLMMIGTNGDLWHGFHCVCSLSSSTCGASTLRRVFNLGAFMVIWSSSFKCALGSSCDSFVHPLFLIFLIVLAMRSLEYLFLQSFMMRNYWFKNILLYHALCIFSCLFPFGVLKMVNGALGCKGELW